MSRGKRTFMPLRAPCRAGGGSSTAAPLARMPSRSIAASGCSSHIKQRQRRARHGIVWRRNSRSLYAPLACASALQAKEKASAYKKKKRRCAERHTALSACLKQLAPRCHAHSAKAREILLYAQTLSKRIWHCNAVNNAMSGRARLCTS